MAYIYSITNTINNKQYIGKTHKSINARFKQHIDDAKREKNSNRSLYRAFKKYGVENFLLEELMQCPDEEASTYEIMFIKKYDTKQKGYNQTNGGDGSLLFDYEKIKELYLKGRLTIREVSMRIGCSVDTVKNVLVLNNINTVTRNSKPVDMFDLNNKFVCSFESIGDAAKYIQDNKLAKTNCFVSIKQKIRYCSHGKNKSAYKFIWRFRN